MKMISKGPRDVPARSSFSSRRKLRTLPALPPFVAAATGDRSRSGIASVALLLLVLAGCAAGPDYKAPRTSAPAAFANGAQTNLNAGEILVTWWRAFNDAELSSLVDRALTNNLDLRIATATLREARAL